MGSTIRALVTTTLTDFKYTHTHTKSSYKTQWPHQSVEKKKITEQKNNMNETEKYITNLKYEYMCTSTKKEPNRIKHERTTTKREKKLST